MAEVEKVTEVQRVHDHDSEVDYRTNVAARLVHYLFGIVIAFIVIRMVLMLLAANQGNLFVDLVYGISSIFVAPFYGIFNYEPVYGLSVFDISAFVAVIVYAFLSWGIGRLFTIGTRRNHVAV